MNKTNKLKATVIINCLLFLVLTLLKTNGVLNVSWYIILIPIYIVAGIALFVLFALISYAVTHKK